MADLSAELRTAERADVRAAARRASLPARVWLGRAGDAGLFGPASLSWRVNREAVLLAGGRRALLMQVAHPLVGAAVREHSRYRTDPLARLWRTLDLMLTIVFADTPGALAAVEAIDRTHGRVRGELGRATGRLPKGTPYDARDPRVGAWVLATLVETSVLVYETVVAPLGPDNRERYYQESRRLGHLLGVTDDEMPPTYEALVAEVEGALVRGDVTVGDDARAIAATLMRPPFFLVPRWVWTFVNPVTAGLLPEPLREGYRLRWGRLEQLAHRAAIATLRQAVRRLPEPLRTVPHAQRALTAV